MMRMESTPSRSRPVAVAIGAALASTGEPVGPTHSSTVLVAPALVDTLILSVPNQSANYEITIEGVPDKCASRYGDATDGRAAHHQRRVGDRGARQRVEGLQRPAEPQVLAAGAVLGGRLWDPRIVVLI